MGNSCQFFLRLAALTVVIGVLGACTQPSKIERARRIGIGQDAGTATGDANLTLTFAKTPFTQNNINVASLTFKLKFLAADLGGAVTFNGEQGSLRAEKLPSKAAGDILVEFYESSALKIVARLPGVTLQSGENNLVLQNFSTDGIELNSGWDGKTFQGNKNWKVEGL